MRGSTRTYYGWRAQLRKGTRKFFELDQGLCKPVLFKPDFGPELPLLKTQMPELHPRFPKSESPGVGRDPSDYIFNKFLQIILRHTGFRATITSHISVILGNVILGNVNSWQCNSHKINFFKLRNIKTFWLVIIKLYMCNRGIKTPSNIQEN